MPQLIDLTEKDVELFERAKTLLDRVYDPVIHQVASVLRADSGQIYEGIHLGSRRINVCAESSAVANSLMAGEKSIDTIVAVCKADNGQVVVTNPCGVCRELMTMYGEDTQVIVDIRGDVKKISAASLLPNPWMFPHENDWLANNPRNSAL